MRSNVNLSRIARAAGCCGIRRMICCGNAKILPEIARDTGEELVFEFRRSQKPVLEKLREEGFPLIGLEQTTHSQCLFDFSFPRRCALIIGNERTGIDDDILTMLDAVVEIPVYGRPYAHNAASATIMALYEYCRQYPKG